MATRKKTRNRKSSLPANMTRDEIIAKDRRLSLKNGSGWAGAFGTNNHAGKSVHLHSVLQLSTAWACIRLTAQAVSCLPLAMYEKRGDDNRVSRL
jgi:phage portal protein BeeE